MGKTHTLAVVLVAALLVGSAAGGVAVASAGQADDDAGTDADCAASSPADFADPDGDVLGWENGTWYDEPLAVEPADGLNDTEREAVLARTMARVEYVRCLEFEEPVPTEVIDRETFQQRGLTGNLTPELRAFDNAKFEALLLVNESTDSIAVQSANRGTSVLGYYDPRNDTITLVSDAVGSPQVDELTLAHELVHALQDQRYNLSSDPFDVRLRDEANAIDGLVEGDARYTERRYEQRCEVGAWAGDCLRESRPSGDGGLVNPGVYFLSYQPYSDGPAFVRFVRSVGGWEAVNALYDRPPASAEQIIDPAAYRADPPTNVSLDDATAGTWERVRPPDRPDYATLGQSALASAFVYPTYHSGGEAGLVEPVEWLNYNESGEVSSVDPFDYENRYVDGWDGDRLHAYRNADGELAYVWRLAWDSPQDAREFVAGYGQLLEYWGAEQVGPETWRIADGGFADAFHVSVDGATVTITNAPTVEGLSEVRTSVDPGATGVVNATAA